MLDRFNIFDMLEKDILLFIKGDIVRKSPILKIIHNKKERIINLDTEERYDTLCDMLETSKQNISYMKKTCYVSCNSNSTYYRIIKKFN